MDLNSCLVTFYAIATKTEDTIKFCNAHAFHLQRHHTRHSHCLPHHLHLANMETTAATSPPHPPLTDLPTELVDIILEKLNPCTLAKCAVICRAWNQVCTPRIWHTVIINSGPRLEHFMTSECQQGLSRNAVHIRNLILLYKSIYNIFSPLDEEAGRGSILPCTNIRRLELHLVSEPRKNNSGGWSGNDFICERLGPPLERAVTTLIRRNPDLKELKIYPSMTPETLLPLLVHDLPQLEVLEWWHNCSFDPPIMQVLLDHLPEGIRRLIIKIDLHGNAESNEHADELRATLGLQEPRQHHSLAHFVPNGLHRPEDYLMLLPFLETCKRKLDVFDKDGVYEWAFQPQVRGALARHGVFLTHFTTRYLPSGTKSSDAEIAGFLRLSAHWKTINLRNCNLAGSLTVATILDNCQDLEYLNIAGCGKISSRNVRSILSTAVCLKEGFIAIGRTIGVGGTGDPVLQGTDLADLVWASHSLAIFSCRISIPRHDPVHSHDIQRRVYKKLAEQSLLKDLILGVSFAGDAQQNVGVWQRDSLDMTLESGMGELACLRSLENLDLSWTNHHVGLLELEWMSENWPCLIFVCGLFSACLDPVPGVHEWIRDYKPEWIS